MEAKNSLDLKKFLDITQRKVSEVYPDLDDPTVARVMHSDLCRMLNAINIAVSYDHTPSRTTFILSTKNVALRKLNPLENFANGLVFCIEDQQVHLVCVPAKDCERLHNFDKLPFKKEEYVMYYLLDGMSFTLYYDAGWKYGTQHSINIYGASYRGIKYSDVFKALKVDYNTLDKLCCYHFRLKCRELHPYNDNVEFVYHTSTFNLETMEFVNADIGVQKPKPISYYDGKGYGCIYRSKSRDGVDFKYETKKRIKITRMLYKPPKISNTAERKKFKVYFAKKNFYILYNYLCISTRTDFIKDFPQFENEYQRYDSFLKATAGLFLGKDPQDERVDEFHAAIKDEILKVYQPKNETDLIRNFLYNTKYAYAIYNYLYPE